MTMNEPALVDQSSNRQPGTRHGYWQAEGLVELSLSRFLAASNAGKHEQQRVIFYHLARFHGRTLRVLNSGLHGQNEALVQAALHNLLALHRGMLHMHRTDPHVVPLPLALSDHSRGDFVRDLVMRVLAETPPALSPETIHGRASRMDLLGELEIEHVHEQLRGLSRAGHVARDGDGYARTHRPYSELDKDVAALRALIGQRFYARFAGAGYDALGSIAEQIPAFKANFETLLGFGDPHTAELFLDVVHLLLDTSADATTAWRHQDLLHSPYPRPYQRAAVNAFRQKGYDSVVIDSPTGSGKTFIGMMCIQDWLRTLDQGQAILVVVPTSNYQQQWIGELCHSPIGLQLPPEILFTGTPGDLDTWQGLTGAHPAILLVTYTALAQLASPTGKGGFDAQSVEQFLQGANVQHVILDEVHKVMEDLHSVSADLARLLVEWQRDTSLRSLIGFSGTAAAYHAHCTALGLSLSYHVEIDELVAAGFVAPFAELGVPFAYSGRERRIRELLDAYKVQMQRYFDLLGPARLRHLFAQIPPEVRQHWGHEILGMYRGRADWQEALTHRFQDWENGRADQLSILEAQLVSIIQLAYGWSDRHLVLEVAANYRAFEAVIGALTAIKTELQELVYLPATLERLRKDGFATELDAAALRDLLDAKRSAGRKVEAAKELLSTTIVGLYEGISDWYRRTGEGRVATIQAVIAAEGAVRDISGVIIFDTGRHLAWRQGVCMPGYQGVGGLFSEMLGCTDLTAMAVLSNEMYLAADPADPMRNPVTTHIADFIREELMGDEVAGSIYNLLVAGIDLPAADAAALYDLFTQRMTHFIASLGEMHAARPGAFRRAIFQPLRKIIKRLKLGTAGERVLARMDRRNVHLTGLIQTFFDYGLLASHFRDAHLATVEQVSGAQQPFFVVTMPGGSRRKQLMYDLTARIVDSDAVPVNLVIVSNWARTGWNVIKPNLLIDATATRDVTAWQQLRGRAIRARRSWSNDCYRLLRILVGDHLLAGQEADEAVESVPEEGPLDAALLQMVAEFATPEQQNRLVAQGVTALPEAERQELAVALLEHRNKVTHIYELVKASGSGSQVIYDRTSGRWQRREAIAAKHAHEVSVNLFTGQKSAGDDHAPLVYADDPRTDVPEQLQQHLQAQIAGCDANIIAGWLQAPKLVPRSAWNAPAGAPRPSRNT